jgi:hypothetical protein
MMDGTKFSIKEKEEINQLIASVFNMQQQQQQQQQQQLILSPSQMIEKEWSSIETNQALDLLRQEDQLQVHLVDLFPKENQHFLGEFPDKIRISLDDQIVRVDCIQVLKVLNVNANCPIQGKTEFIEMERTLEFTPSMAFEPNTTYQIKIRAQDIYTTLGFLHHSKTFFFSIGTLRPNDS